MNTRRRRDYGTAKERTPLYGRIRPETKAKVDALADLRHISQAQALELILDHVEVDLSGDLSWVVPTSETTDQEELPIVRSA